MYIYIVKNVTNLEERNEKEVQINHNQILYKAEDICILPVFRTE